MLTKLFSKLSLYGSNNDGSHRESRGIDTEVNLFPELAEQSPRIAPEVSYFLSIYGRDANEILEKPVISVPDYDDSLPLADYFVSSSHNTYLLENQLWGKSCASAYTHVITNGAHCIEIDVWPGQSNQGPIVTHGWTLTQDVCFRDVCKAVRSAIEEKDDDWPVFVSLECHVGLEGQKELVEIMKEAWGDRLVDAHVEGYEKDAVRHVSPRQLKGRIVMMIEHYPEGKDQEGSDPDSADPTNDEDESQKTNACVKISDELAKLGIYALSVKPKKDWHRQALENVNILINISESALSSLLPHALSDLISHGQRHLRRVYPRGTRIMSDNLNPLTAWRAGSHFAALNWQGYDKGMQMNEAMFVGSSGWAPKPSNLRATGAGVQREAGRVGFSVDIIGLSSLKHPDGKDAFKARVRVVIYHESGKIDWKSRVSKAKASSPDDGADAMFNDTCSWVFDSDELAFIRIVVSGDDDNLALFCARLSHIQLGHRFIRLLDMKGKDSGATLLVNFTISNVT